MVSKKKIFLNQTKEKKIIHFFSGLCCCCFCFISTQESSNRKLNENENNLTVKKETLGWEEKTQQPTDKHVSDTTIGRLMIIIVWWIILGFVCFPILKPVAVCCKSFFLSFSISSHYTYIVNCIQKK